MTAPAAVAAALGEDLRAARYTDAGVAALLGDTADAALRRGQRASARTALEQAPEDPLAVIVALFGLRDAVGSDRVAAALPRAGVDALLAAGVLVGDGSGDGAAAAGGAVRAALDVRPHAVGDRDLLLVADLARRDGAMRLDHVLGSGAAAMSLAHAVVREPVRRALDLGVGGGVQSLHLAAHCREIVATDVHRRALSLAAATAAMNGMTWDLRQGSLFAPVAGERFDLVVSNPPFVVGTGAVDYGYRDSGMAGDEVSRTLIREVGDHLTPGGTAQFTANWVVPTGGDWRERVGGWLADTGLHA